MTAADARSVRRIDPGDPLLNTIAPLFSGWEDTMVRAVLQGHMGYALVNDDSAPSCAQLVLGDFCFFAGRPDDALIAAAAASELVPKDEAWFEPIERVWGDRVIKRLRYAIQRNPYAFCREKLQRLVDALPADYELMLFDETICGQSKAEHWSCDFCDCFCDDADFLRRGFGAAVLHQGKLVSGASSYALCDGEIEIEIDTSPDYRRLGLATACGARLILEALDRGLYPSWDAFDLRSVSLSEKFGYSVDRPYVIYMMR